MSRTDVHSSSVFIYCQLGEGEEFGPSYITSFAVNLWPF